MVPGSRNPMWGEEFNFSVDELPVEVFVLCTIEIIFLSGTAVHSQILHEQLVSLRLFPIAVLRTLKAQNSSS